MRVTKALTKVQEELWNLQGGIEERSNFWGTWCANRVVIINPGLIGDDEISKGIEESLQDRGSRARGNQPSSMVKEVLGGVNTITTPAGKKAVTDKKGSSGRGVRSQRLGVQKKASSSSMARP
jgi:hypothetical protein